MFPANLEGGATPSIVCSSLWGALCISHVRCVGATRRSLTGYLVLPAADGGHCPPPAPSPAPFSKVSESLSGKAGEVVVATATHTHSFLREADCPPSPSSIYGDHEDSGKRKAASFAPKAWMALAGPRSVVPSPQTWLGLFISLPLDGTTASFYFHSSWPLNTARLFFP